MAITICTTIFHPLGIIDFDRLDGRDVYVAKIEGVAACTTVLKLKDSGVFIENSYCFGTDRIKGTYYIKKDTLWFSCSINYYQFGIFKRTNDGKVLELHKNKKDNYPLSFSIIKDDL